MKKNEKETLKDLKIEKDEARNKAGRRELATNIVISVAICMAVGVIVYACHGIYSTLSKKNDADNTRDTTSTVAVLKDPDLDPYIQGNAPIGGGPNRPTDGAGNFQGMSPEFY